MSADVADCRSDSTTVVDCFAGDGAGTTAALAFAPGALEGERMADVPAI